MLPYRLIREPLALRDGRKVTLRPIRPEDAERLMDLHSRLSRETQYLRFFGPKPHLTRPEAEYLANVDMSTRFALVATTTEDGGEQIVGVARFDIKEPGVAEPAIVVRDDYQRSGLGRALTDRLMEIARGHGVHTFAAEVLTENMRMLRILETEGLSIGPADEGVVRVEAPIEKAPVLFRGMRMIARYTATVVDTPGKIKRFARSVRSRGAG